MVYRLTMTSNYVEKGSRDDEIKSLQKKAEKRLTVPKSSVDIAQIALSPSATEVKAGIQKTTGSVVRIWREQEE
jgi:hypothetical protein